MKLSIIVPVYNEHKTIKEVLNKLSNVDLGSQTLEKEIIIVEGNSKDGTKEIVETFNKNKNFKIIFEDIPLGKGSAVRKGLDNASGEIIMIQDGDLEYSFKDYPNLLKPILDKEANFVLGTRHKSLNPFKMRVMNNSPLKALILNIGHVILQKIFNFLYKQDTTDIFTMYKVFRKKCLNDMILVRDKFDFDMELVCKIVKQGNKPLEVPVTYNSRGWDQGKKYSLLKDTPGVIWTLIKVRYFE